MNRYEFLLWNQMVGVLQRAHAYYAGVAIDPFAKFDAAGFWNWFLGQSREAKMDGTGSLKANATVATQN